MLKLNGLTRSCCASIWVIAVLSLAALTAHADTTTFAIEPQDLSGALKAFAVQSHREIFFAPELARGRKSNGVKGKLDDLKALNIILEGTGLNFSVTTSNAILVRDPSGKSESSKSTALPASVSAADAPVRVAQLDQSGAGPQAISDDQNSEKKKQEGLTEIVVTGTHISGGAPIGTPIRTIDSAEIAESGFTTTQDLIDSLPQNFRGGAGAASPDVAFQSGAYSGYNNSFGSGINLRGLGNTATLILINGHRVASSGTGYFTDISTIPISAIDHIDVLTDGASAIYGSEAIAGVINIVLKKDSEGLETAARFGSAHGFSTDGGNLQLGHRWTNGGATIGADFSHQDTLDASQRSFTSSVNSPTSIFPSYTQTAISAAVHQDVADRLEFHGDAQYAKKTLDSFNSSSDVPPFGSTASDVDRWSGSAGTSYAIFNGWKAAYDVSLGREVDYVTADTFSPGAQPSLFSLATDSERFTDQNLGLTGQLFSLPGGPVKLAVGVARRTENYALSSYTVGGLSGEISASRNVTSGYSEVRVPIFSEANALPGFEALTLSAAVRYDHYSDFGGTTNPKYGLSWSLNKSFEIRGAYSTSFRAPATGTELANSLAGTTAAVTEAVPGPSGSAQVPLVEIYGGKSDLRPETARNVTLGFDWKTPFVPGLQWSFNYYNISYVDQLAAAPYSPNPLNTPALAPVISEPGNAAIQALVEAAIANRAQYFDITGGVFGPNPLGLAQYLYDDRTQNLSSTKTSGVDLTVRYHFTVDADQIDTRLDVTRIDTFTAKLTSTSPAISEVNTVGYPARLRLRGLGAWAHGPLMASLAANYVSSYQDTSDPTPRDVGTFLTLDSVVRYKFAHEIVASVAVINLFNRLPPYVYSGTPRFAGSHYDPANADPTGRMINLQLAKQW
jgi:iron complex outermembrane receptor protein